jgi:hypothetical protein
MQTELQNIKSEIESLMNDFQYQTSQVEQNKLRGEDKEFHGYCVKQLTDITNRLRYLYQLIGEENLRIAGNICAGCANALNEKRCVSCHAELKHADNRRIMQRIDTMLSTAQIY